QPWFLLLAVVVPITILVLRFTLVDSPKLQLALSALTRCLILALLVPGLACLLRVSKSNSLAVVVLADVSDSVPDSAVAQISNFWAQAKARLSSKAKAGLALFAATNEVIVSCNPQHKASIVAAPSSPGAAGTARA